MLWKWTLNWVYHVSYYSTVNVKFFTRPLLVSYYLRHCHYFNISFYLRIYSMQCGIVKTVYWYKPLIVIAGVFIPNWCVWWACHCLLQIVRRLILSSIVQSESSYLDSLKRILQVSHISAQVTGVALHVSVERLCFYGRQKKWNICEWTYLKDWWVWVDSLIWRLFCNSHLH